MKPTFKEFIKSKGFDDVHDWCLDTSMDGKETYVLEYDALQNNPQSDPMKEIITLNKKLGYAIGVIETYRKVVTMHDDRKELLDKALEVLRG